MMEVPISSRPDPENCMGSRQDPSYHMRRWHPRSDRYDLYHRRRTGGQIRQSGSLYGVVRLGLSD